jgi:CHAD domain-containing protein
MKNSAAIKFLHQRIRNLERHSESLLEEFDVEDIHQFRVEMKKLRALLRLLNAGGELAEPLRIGKKVHRFYDATGDLRSLQLQRKTVIDLAKKLTCKVPSNYLNHLQKKETETKASIRPEASHLSFRKLQNRMLKAAHEKFTSSVVERFIASKKYALLKLLAIAVYQDEQLHGLRKLLKDLLYVWPLIGPAIVQSFPKKGLTKKSCDALTEKLGLFQDLFVALTYFDTAYETNVPNEERAVLETFRSHCENHKATLKEQITNQLADLRDDMEKNDLLFKVYEII